MVENTNTEKQVRVNRVSIIIITTKKRKKIKNNQ